MEGGDLMSFPDNQYDEQEFINSELEDDKAVIRREDIMKEAKRLGYLTTVEELFKRLGI